MESGSVKGGSASSAREIARRFMHLMSAQTVEGVTSWGFFVYLTWVNSTLYGEVMYALAAGSVAMIVIQFGLYYALVPTLGRAERDKAPEILNRVNVIKLALFVPSMIAVACISFYRGISAQMGSILFFVSLGYGLEALAETFFEDLRVRGLQAREARIKAIASILSYGYGALAAALGFNPVLVSLFKLVSAVVQDRFRDCFIRQGLYCRFVLAPTMAGGLVHVQSRSAFCCDRDSRNRLQQDKHLLPGECNWGKRGSAVQRCMECGGSDFHCSLRPIARMGGLPIARFAMVDG